MRGAPRAQACTVHACARRQVCLCVCWECHAQAGRVQGWGLTSCDACQCIYLSEHSGAGRRAGRGWECDWCGRCAPAIARHRGPRTAADQVGTCEEGFWEEVVVGLHVEWESSRPRGEWGFPVEGTALQGLEVGWGGKEAGWRGWGGQPGAAAECLRSCMGWGLRPSLGNPGGGCGMPSRQRDPGGRKRVVSGTQSQG